MRVQKIQSILVPLTAALFLAGSVTGTELKNIEKITPQGSEEIDITGKMDLNGKSLTDSSGTLSLEGGNVEVPNGNLAVSGNTDGVDLDNPGTAITVNSNQYEVADNSISVTELDTGSTDTRYLNRGGDAMNGDLNLNNYDIKKVSNLDVSTSSEQIASFSSTGIDFNQPLSLESAGPLSVANGIELTGTSSNTLESYSTLYLETSSGSPSDIVLDPTGQVGMDSNLSVKGNINPNSDLEISNPSSTDNTVDIGGSLGVEGVLDLNDNELQNVLNIKSTSNNDLRIGAGGGGSDRIRIRDRANGKDIAEFEEGTQNVYIPEGKLSVSKDGNDKQVLKLKHQTKDAVFRIERGGGTALRIRQRGSNDGTLFQTGGGTDMLRLIQNSQNVEIPNGNLNMAGDSSITGVNSISNGGQGKEDLTISASSNKNNVVIEGKGRPHQIRTSGATSNVANFYDDAGDGDGSGGVVLDINDEFVSLKSNDLNDIGTSNVDMVYDSNDDRVEIRSNGEEDICIGNCGA